MSLTPAMRTYLSAFAQFAPAFAASAAQATTRAYTLSFKPGVLEQASGLMKASGRGWRATAVNKSGRIVGQGRLDQISNVRVLSSAVAVWQVMAVITAQVHLAEINERLIQIERGINDIKAWLAADKIATLLNAQRYVAEMREAFATRSLTAQDIAGFEHQLERLWVDCGQVETALRLLQDERHQQFMRLELGSWWGLDAQVVAAQDCIGRYERLTQAYLLAMQTRAVLVCGRAALPLSRDVTVQRLEMLRAELQQQSEARQRFLTDARTHVRERLSATFHIGTTNDTYRGKVLGAVDLTEGTLWQQSTDVLASINQIEQRLTTQRQIAEQPYTLIFTLDAQGEIVECYSPIEG